MSAKKTNEQILFDTCDDYYVLSISNYQGDTWKAIGSSHHLDEANVIAEREANDGWTSNGVDASRVVRTIVVTKHELVDDYEIKVSQALKTISSHGYEKWLGN